MQDALTAVQELFLGLQQKVGMLSMVNSTEADKAAFLEQYRAARTAYQSCVNKIFANDDPEVADLTTKLTDATQQIAESEKNLGNISKWLDDITQAVTFATQLAALAAG
jgi:hypothetical protein